MLADNQAAFACRYFFWNMRIFQYPKMKHHLQVFEVNTNLSPLFHPVIEILMLFCNCYNEFACIGIYSDNYTPTYKYCSLSREVWKNMLKKLHEFIELTVSVKTQCLINQLLCTILNTSTVAKKNLCIFSFCFLKKWKHPVYIGVSTPLTNWDCASPSYAGLLPPHYPCPLSNL